MYGRRSRMYVGYMLRKQSNWERITLLRASRISEGRIGAAADRVAARTQGIIGEVADGVFGAEVSGLAAEGVVTRGTTAGGLLWVHIDRVVTKRVACWKGRARG